MFRSQLTGKVSEPGVAPVRLVIETRKMRYENVVNKELKVSYGTEIVSEILIHPSEVEQVKQFFKLVD